MKSQLDIVIDEYISLQMNMPLKTISHIEKIFDLDLKQQHLFTESTFWIDKKENIQLEQNYEGRLYCRMQLSIDLTQIFNLERGSVYNHIIRWAEKHLELPEELRDIKAIDWRWDSIEYYFKTT